MTLYKKIITTLQNNKIPYQEHRHEPVRTSEEAAKVRGSSMDIGAKSLIFRADKQPIQIIIQASKKIDKNKFKKAFNIKDLAMVSYDEVIQITSVEPGGVPPFSNLFDKPLEVFVNETLLKNKEIEFNAGDRSISIKMNTTDWLMLVKPTIGLFEAE